MSGVLITKRGKVLVSGGEEDALIDYGKKVKVLAVDIMTYLNDVAQIYVSYADGALGAMRGLSKSALWAWASEQKKWPLRITHQVSVPYPAVFDPTPEPPVAVMKRTRRSLELPVADEAPAPVKLRRTRAVIAEVSAAGTKRLRRTR